MILKTSRTVKNLHVSGWRLNASGISHIPSAYSTTLFCTTIMRVLLVNPICKIFIECDSGQLLFSIISRNSYFASRRSYTIIAGAGSILVDLKDSEMFLQYNGLIRELHYAPVKTSKLYSLLQMRYFWQIEVTHALCQNTQFTNMRKNVYLRLKTNSWKNSWRQTESWTSLFTMNTRMHHSLAASPLQVRHPQMR